MAHCCLEKLAAFVGRLGAVGGRSKPVANRRSTLVAARAEFGNWLMLEAFAKPCRSRRKEALIYIRLVVL